MTQQASISPEVVVLPDPATLATEAARRFAALAESATAEHGVFTVALSGGSTPRSMFELLAKAPYKESIDWARAQMFFSDERFVPPDSEESNFRMAKEALLSHVALPESSVHPVPTIGITADEAAARYEETVRRKVLADPGRLPRFDLILLGLGPDGHTASLFPDSTALSESVRLVAPNYVAKFDSWRITFTFPLINAARCVMFLAQGSEKAERVRQVFESDPTLPASGVRPSRGRLVWLLDEAAAAEIRPRK
jgi:6-phosphogluconolactonase